MPDVLSYNSRKHCRIFIIFGRNITEKVGNQKMLYFAIQDQEKEQGIELSVSHTLSDDHISDSNHL